MGRKHMKLKTPRLLIIVLVFTHVLFLGYVVEGRDLTSKVDDHVLASKSMKISFGMDPSFSHTSDAMTSSTAANGDTNNSGSADQFAGSFGASTDSHHQITVDQYHRMSGNLTPHP
jgi:hypothetical protein